MPPPAVSFCLELSSPVKGEERCRMTDVTQYLVDSRIQA
jgi:hypothetical protein